MASTAGYADNSQFSIEKAEYRKHLTTAATLRQLQAWGVPVSGQRVVDLGCGSGGGVLALAAAGAHAHGIDLDANAIVVARQQARERGLPVTFDIGDVTDPPPPSFQGHADLVLLQEVIEHVKNIEQVLRTARAWLKPHGRCMVTFPPYYSPAGGHHHHARQPYRYIPWLHLILPQQVLLRCLPQDARYREEVRTLNRITISQFEAAVAATGWCIRDRVAYLIRPSISVKLSLPTISGGRLLRIPWLREWMLTGVEYLLG
ncbi:MAG: class I SAM-dependent methyltransferase [Gammaproteobacteria bacterium]